MRHLPDLTDLVPYEERRRRIEQEPLPANIGALLAEAAAEAPDRLAWHFFETGEKATYRQVRDEVDRLADGLAAQGIGRGTHVSVMLPNIPALPLAWLALAALGAVMVPVNMRYTAHELRYVLEDSESTHLILHEDILPLAEAVLGELPRLRGRTVVVGGAQEGHVPWAALLEAPPRPRAEPPAQQDVANIQYTSGTTGFPKGCLLPHLYWLMVGKVHARCDDQTYGRILVTLPFFYMTAQWQLMMAFHQRATVFVAARQSASHFLEWVRAHGIDFCILPIPAFKTPEHPADRDNAVLRANIYGLPPAEHAAVEQRFGVRAREGFGMTEIGAGMIVPLEAARMVGSGSCGIPAPFRECRVVDEQGETVPPGTVGELVVRGPGIMQGYWRKPEANAASFFGDWFRTGDLFRQDEQGWFYILGRTKDMVRRSGENIAAREVEAVLMSLPEVEDAAVVPVPDSFRGEEVKAYLILREGLAPADLPLDRVLRHCEERLAVFKVPRYIAFRTEPFPRTASGKLSKPPLIQEVQDLRAGAWDRVTGRWI